MGAARIEDEEPSSNWIKKCGDELGSKGISMTVPTQMCPVIGLTLAKHVPGGKDLLIKVTSS